MTTLMCNQLSPGLPEQLESVRVNIGLHVVRTDGRSVTRLPNFLGWVDLFTHGAPQARFARGALLSLHKLLERCRGYDVTPQLCRYVTVSLYYYFK